MIKNRKILTSVLIVSIVVLGIIIAESSKQDSQECTESIDSMELIVEKPTAFMQYMPTDFNMEHIRFGIYRDENLKDPIDEADAGYNFNVGWHIEEGAELSDYPEELYTKNSSRGSRLNKNWLRYKVAK